jgi:putative phosphoribosyl transferase
VFKDRIDAGRRLADALAARHLQDSVVYALPRGGVPVGAEVARRLKCPLSVILVRKIGVPYQPELAMGAIVDGPEQAIIRNEDIIRECGITDAEFDKIAQVQWAEIERRRALYFANAPPVAATGKTALLIDDGLATGATARAAVKALRLMRPRTIGLAIPVATPETLRLLEREVDWVLCLEPADYFPGVGSFYRNFAQVTDDAVVALLDEFAQRGRGNA